MRTMLKWLDDNLEAALASLLLLTMVCFTLIQIAGRYILSTPFPWTEELTRYMFIWMVFIAVGYSTKGDNHIRITFTRLFFKGKNKLAYDIFADIVSFGFSVICLIVAAGIMRTIARGGQTSSSVMWLPMWMVYLAMPAGFCFYCIRLVQNIITKIRNIKNYTEEQPVAAVPAKEGE